MPRDQRPAPRKRETPPKPAKRGTPIKNSILLIIFVAVLAALVIVMPKEPARQSATYLVAGEASGDGTVENIPVRISEVMASNRSAYPDDKGNYSDWLEIENTSLDPVNLDGLGLSDRDDRILFIFPNIELAGGERVVVFCDDTNVAGKDAPLHARFKISALGETLSLFDRSGVAFNSIVVPALNSDVSYALTTGGWITTEQYTPGYPNTEEGYAAFRSATVVSASGLVLNEIVASNITTLQDEDGEYPDWIELYNGGNVPIDLSYYALSDDEADPIKWRFPQGAVIQPNEYYLVFASGKDRPGGDGRHPHTNFKLAAEGETVVLSDILRQVVDRETYDNLGKDVSWGRVEGLEYTWQEYKQPTPGMPNNQQSMLEMDKRMRARNQSGVYISEVMTSSTGVETPYGPTSYDWVEIVNLGNQTVDLNKWGLSDNVGRPRKWQFPAVSIAPGEYLLVFTSGETSSPTGSSAMHADFRLSALGETVTLCDPQGNIVDKLVVPRLERDNTYGRNFDQGGLFYYDTPTPAAANTAQGFEGYALKPEISLKGGVYHRSITVTLSAAPGVTILYTTDGTNPTEQNGIPYTGPLEITGTTPLRVRGFQQGLKPSEVITETYLVNVYHSLPIICLTIDHDDLYNDEDGILGIGTEEDFAKDPFDLATYWKKTPHPGNFEYFEIQDDGITYTQEVNQMTEIQLNGQFSLDLAQKSFRITARNRYGSSALAYPFFDDRPFSEYQAVILRNGGQDGKYTRIIDALQSKIIDWTGADILHMASNPVIVFLNGEYWGHYNLRERINKYSIAAYEGWDDPKNIDFIKGENKVISGSYSNYKALRDFIKANDLNDPAALQTVLDWVDVDNYFDFMIFQIYFGNTDAGNIKFYRERTEGSKWRWVVFDLDWGLFNSELDGCNAWLKEAGAGDRRFDNSLIRALLAVPEMREKFITRYGRLYQDVLSDTDRIRAEADRMIAVIEPEMPMHYQRWAGETNRLLTEEPVTPEGNLKYWRDRIDRMHNVLLKRPHFAWQHVKDWFDLSNEEMMSYFGPQPELPEGVK